MLRMLRRGDELLAIYHSYKLYISSCTFKKGVKNGC